VTFLAAAVASSGLGPEGWTAVALVGAAIFGFFGSLVKLIADARKDNKELQNRVMDRAIPALEANAEATKLMVSVMQQVTTALAVQQAVKDQTVRDQRDRHLGTGS
jgi:hypothetical protein